jgi:hypothetical protein
MSQAVSPLSVNSDLQSKSTNLSPIKDITNLNPIPSDKTSKSANSLTKNPRKAGNSTTIAKDSSSSSAVAGSEKKEKNAKKRPLNEDPMDTQESNTQDDGESVISNSQSSIKLIGSPSGKSEASEKSKSSQGVKRVMSPAAKKRRLDNKV